MLTTSEKRFIRYWQDQRKGGRWSYLTLYILAGTFIASIVIFFLLSVFMISVKAYVWAIPASGFVIVGVISYLSWVANEKRFKSIIRREVEEGKMHDGNGIHS